MTASPAKSRGHVAFIGEREFVLVADGSLAVGDRRSPLDASGFRLGLRFEATPVMAARMLALHLAAADGSEIGWKMPEAERLLEAAHG